MRVALALILLATTPSCALLASSNAAHSRISPCVDDPTFAVVDLVIAGGITGGLAASNTLDQSAAWLLVPSVFLASGVIGAIYATKCGGKTEPASLSYENLPVSAPYRLPETTEEVPYATAEDLGVPPPAPAVEQPKPVVGRPKLTLDPDYKLPDPSPKTTDPSEIECDASATTCPASHSCALGKNGRGYCVKDR